MKTIIKTLILSAVVLLSSCSKSEDNSSNNATPTPADGFYYSENGSTTMTAATSAYASNQFKSIFALNGSNTAFEINLTSIAVGTYTINSSNALAYIKPGGSQLWSASAGTITITSNANNKLTGTFNATTGSGITGVNSVSGTFTNITIQ